MATRAALNHAALRITPPPHSLHETREIYRSLRKFGEIELYRSLRHEASTVEPKEDAVVLFRDQAAFGDAIKASPLNISVPTVKLSPMPSLRSFENSSLTQSDALRSNRFRVEVTKREYNHETRIINQLFTYTQAPYSITHESPPGVSINFSSKLDPDRASDVNEYRLNIIRTTGGGWKSWRMEMRQAGIPEYGAIKATADTAFSSRESGPPFNRSGSSSWARPSYLPDNKSLDRAQTAPPKVHIIANPTPLPLDPTLQKSRSSPTGEKRSSWRQGASLVSRSFKPTSQEMYTKIGSVTQFSPREPIESSLRPEDWGDKGKELLISAAVATAPVLHDIHGRGGNAEEEPISNKQSAMASHDSDSPPVEKPRYKDGINTAGTTSPDDTMPLRSLAISQETCNDDDPIENHGLEKQRHKEDVTASADNDTPVVMSKGQKSKLVGQITTNEKAAVDIQLASAKTPHLDKSLEPEQNSIETTVSSESAPPAKRWWSLPWQR